MRGKSRNIARHNAGPGTPSAARRHVLMAGQGNGKPFRRDSHRLKIDTKNRAGGRASSAIASGPGWGEVDERDERKADAPDHTWPVRRHPGPGCLAGQPAFAVRGERQVK